MATLRLNRYAALVLGILVPMLETWRRWGQLGDPRLIWFWFDDVLLGSLLVLGFVQSGRSQAGIAYLTAGWAFACAMAYLSLVTQLARLNRGDPSGLSPALVATVKAIGLAIIVWGLVTALRAATSAQESRD